MMKKSIIIIFTLLISGLLHAQEKFTVPQLTGEQKSEVLYNHVIAYAATGISFAKSQGVSPEEYGRFIGKKFTAYWDPESGFPAFVRQFMFILSGLHPDNDMQIVKQDENSITFKLKNVDLSFKEGPMFDVTYDDFLECSAGIISVLAKFMGADFSHEMTNDGWYVVKLAKI